MNASSEKYDVVVIGGGPGGSTLASLVTMQASCENGVAPFCGGVARSPGHLRFRSAQTRRLAMHIKSSVPSLTRFFWTMRRRSVSKYKKKAQSLMCCSRTVVLQELSIAPPTEVVARQAPPSSSTLAGISPHSIVLQ